MERSAALVLTFVIFLVFTVITYYGAMVTLWSSIIFAIFVSLILLNLFYPISQINTDEADASLVVYAVFEIFGIILLAIYIAQRSLSDVRRSTNFL